MREAMHYERLGSGAVRCSLCPRRCRIPEGGTGVCGVRGNRGGVLYALTYGKVASSAVDPIEKKPLYHFYPGSRTFSIGGFGCNLRCKHCQNWRISHHAVTAGGEGLYDLLPEELVEEAARRGCTAIAWTYNEPSVWFEYVLEGARLARERGILTVLVTAGVINPPALRELLPHLDAYRLDVKGFSEGFYERLTGVRVLATVLGSAVIAREAGVHLEIVTNIIPNWNDSDGELDALSKWIVTSLGSYTPWHVTAYFPSFEVSEPPTPLSTLERARRIGIANGLEYVYVGNVPGHPAQHTLCPACGKTLIERHGFRIAARHIVRGHCASCGYEIRGYRDFDLPVDRRHIPRGGSSGSHRPSSR